MGNCCTTGSSWQAKSADADFNSKALQALVRQKDKPEFEEQMKQADTGGPSLLFHRGETSNYCDREGDIVLEIQPGTFQKATRVESGIGANF